MSRYFSAARRVLRRPGEDSTPSTNATVFDLVVPKGPGSSDNTQRSSIALWNANSYVELSDVLEMLQVHTETARTGLYLALLGVVHSLFRGGAEGSSLVTPGTASMSHHLCLAPWHS